MPPSMTQDTYCHISERLDSIAPFGRDSVPDVYISRTRSSSPTSTGGGVPARSIQCRRSAHPAGTSSPRSRITARTGTSSPAASTALTAVAASPSSATNPLAWLWPRM